MRDVRVHVGIDPETQAAEDGVLFSTEALDFGARRETAGKSSKAAVPEMALYSEFGLPDGMAEEKLLGLIPLGGEGRLSAWSASNRLLDELAPGELIEQVLKSRRLRMVLMTPAWFEHGWQAEWMRASRLDLSDGSAMELELVAAVVPRFAPISGWDLARRAPKPTRFLAPAGSVYFFKLGEAVREEHLKRLWLSPVSEEPESGRSLRRDGFGLVAFGSWDAATLPMG